MEKKTELQANAIAEARKMELETYQRALDMQWLDSRMEDGRMGRCLALVKREAELEKDYQERTDHAAIVNARAAKETALGLEIAKIDREKAVEYLRRHYIRERDPSLRELARKLQAGYMCRDLQQQIRNNEYKKLEQQAIERQADEKLRESIYSHLQYEAYEAQNKSDRVAKYSKELKQQLVYRNRQQQCQYEESLIEKKMLDEILRTMADEDKREIEEKRRLTEKTRSEMQTFKISQDQWREKHKKMVLMEEKEIEKQAKELSDRQAAVIAERKRIQDAKDASNQKIAAKVMADAYAKQERDNIIKLLQEQERLEKDIQDDKACAEKLQRVKRETKNALQEQMQIKKEQERQMKESEKDYLRQVKEKLAADEAKERQKELLVREKNKQHCRELLKQAEEMKRQRQRNAEDDARRTQAVWDYQNKWQEEVNRERSKIVKEHAPKLLGYLQAGVLKKEDLPDVREGANMDPELAKLNIEALASTKRAKTHPKCNVQCDILRRY